MEGQRTLMGQFQSREFYDGGSPEADGTPERALKTGSEGRVGVCQEEKWRVV